MISTITATQKFSSIHPLIRVNATELYIYRLRNHKDLETFIDEVSAVSDKKNINGIVQHSYIRTIFFFICQINSKDQT